MIRLFLLSILVLVFSACATKNPIHVDGIREGMDKAQALDVAGNPKRTFRTNGQDHWIYVFYKNDQELTRQIDFEDGKVVKIGRDAKKQNWDKEIEGLKRTGK